MKKFFALVALVAVALTACDKGGNEPSYSSALKFNKTEVQFGKNGGEQKVTFTISNPAGGKVTAEDSAEWLDAIVEFNSEVIITAEANSGEAREAKVTVKYAGAKDVIITVTQKAGNAGDYDVEFKAKRFEGIYFGQEYSDNYNYYIVLSDYGLDLNANPKANGTYYYFDIYSATAGDEEYPVLPNGTYTLDSTNTYGDGTLSEAGSFFGVMNAEGKFAKSINFKNATVTVENEKFVAIIEMTNGETHYVTYEGDLLVDSDYIYSTFNEDFTFAIENANISATNYGDVYQVGKQAWYIEAVNGNDLFKIEVLANSAATPEGVYTKFTGESYENKYIAGYIDEDGLQGTWYAKLTGGVIKGDVMAPIVDGVVQIVVEDNTATINYSAKDDAGNKIEGSVSGSYTKKEPEM